MDELCKVARVVDDPARYFLAFISGRLCVHAGHDCVAVHVARRQDARNSEFFVGVDDDDPSPRLVVAAGQELAAWKDEQRDVVNDHGIFGRIIDPALRFGSNCGVNNGVERCQFGLVSEDDFCHRTTIERSGVIACILDDLRTPTSNHCFEH